jgi:hypothetical protein
MASEVERELAFDLEGGLRLVLIRTSLDLLQSSSSRNFKPLLLSSIFNIDTLERSGYDSQECNTMLCDSATAGMQTTNTACQASPILDFLAFNC